METDTTDFTHFPVMPGPEMVPWKDVLEVVLTAFAYKSAAKAIADRVPSDAPAAHAKGISSICRAKENSTSQKWKLCPPLMEYRTKSQSKPKEAAHLPFLQPIPEGDLQPNSKKIPPSVRQKDTCETHAVHWRGKHFLPLETQAPSLEDTVLDPIVVRIPSTALNHL